ncbi:MAG: hypothetical protein AMXMBFR33_25310 [Candidatus Xenobia bacterium]
MARLLVALTAHGFGHLGQSAPILNSLRGVELILATTLPQAVLERHLTVPFTRIERALDVGVRNQDALTVDRPGTRRAYQEFHARYPSDLDEETAWLRSCAPDAVLANVPYRVAEAAARLGIPCLAMCSLNWGDIVAGCLGEVACLPAIRRAYASVTEFWQPIPSMPMESLPRRRELGLVARRGMRRSLGLSGKLVLVSLGGLPLPRPSGWPDLPGVTWLVPEGWLPGHPRAVAVESLPVPFIDLVASADLLITKPGYGSFAEAASHGLPVLSLRRRDWPEEACLWEFMQRRGGLRELGREAFLGGDFGALVEELLEEPRPEPIEPEGVAQAVERLGAYLEG